MNGQPPRAFFVPDRIREVRAGWDSIGEQWFVELYQSDEDPRFYRHAIINADGAVADQHFLIDVTSNVSRDDQLFDELQAILKAVGYEPASFEPNWLSVPLTIYQALKVGDIPYNTRIITRNGASVVFDVADPDGPSPITDPAT